MKILTHHVLQGSIIVDGQQIASIEKGLACFLGFKVFDTWNDVETKLNRLFTLRIFADASGKTNLSLLDIQGDLLIIPNFTLYADTTSRRPSFSEAMPFEEASKLFQASVQYLKSKYPKIQTGQFGADMKISLIHDGPFTLTL